MKILKKTQIFMMVNVIFRNAWVKNNFFFEKWKCSKILPGIILTNVEPEFSLKTLKSKDFTLPRIESGKKIILATKSGFIAFYKNRAENCITPVFYLMNQELQSWKIQISIGTYIYFLIFPTLCISAVLYLVFCIHPRLDISEHESPIFFRIRLQVIGTELNFWVSPCVQRLW